MCENSNEPECVEIWALLLAAADVQEWLDQAQCANKVRQLGIALQGYVTENNAYPFIEKILIQKAKGFEWNSKLFPLVRVHLG